IEDVLPTGESGMKTQLPCLIGVVTVLTAASGAARGQALTLSTSPTSPITYGTSVTLTALLNNYNGSGTYVDFYDNGVFIGAGAVVYPSKFNPSTYAQLTIANPSVRTHNLVAFCCE